MNPIFSALSAVFKPIGEYFKDKQVIKAEVTKRKDELKKMSLETKLEGIRKSTNADIETDLDARKYAGFMDDISFYLFLSPLFLVFIPDMQPHVMAGFAALEEVPEWYKYALAMMLVSVWGWKKVFAPVITKILKKRFGL